MRSGKVSPAVHETAEEIEELQRLLDSSYRSAGAHLLSIHTVERRLSAEQVAARLTGMRLLSLATATADGRPIVGAVDSIFYRGAFHFGSSADALRVRHVRARPQVSAVHLPSEQLAITVHGRATAAGIDGGFRQALLGVYGEEFESFLDSGPLYFRIEAERMFAFAIADGGEPEFARPLRERDVAGDPFRQFADWFAQARASGVRVPEAAALATATPDGMPSVRMVLVKAVDEPGFVFYSNYESRKGSELAQNARAALLFHWERLGRQVRVEGSVQRIAAEESAAYVRSRPLASQLSALASPQSRVIESRAWLERRVAELASQGEPAPPDWWGGFRLAPERFEFWQHREDRLHDRLLYARAPGGAWRLERLAP
jgi:pyridoxamine 5'-phosphate oxidase